MSKPLDDLSHAVETVTLLLPYLPATERNMRASMPEPGGTSYDAGRPGAVAWCDRHEQEVERCHKAEHGCVGIPLDTMSDPTGEGAIDSPVFAEAREVRRIARAWSKDAEWLTHLVSRYRETVIAEELDIVHDDNRPRCEVHASAALDEEANGGVMERVGDWPLPSPMRVCSSCRHRIKTTRRIPTPDDVRYFTERLRWPHLYETGFGEAS